MRGHGAYRYPEAVQGRRGVAVPCPAVHHLTYDRLHRLRHGDPLLSVHRKARLQNEVNQPLSHSPHEGRCSKQALYHRVLVAAEAGVDQADDPGSTGLQAAPGRRQRRGGFR